jgi:hypothetical protein
MRAPGCGIQPLTPKFSRKNRRAGVRNAIVETRRARSALPVAPPEFDCPDRKRATQRPQTDPGRGGNRPPGPGDLYATGIGTFEIDPDSHKKTLLGLRGAAGPWDLLKGPSCRPSKLVHGFYPTNPATPGERLPVRRLRVRFGYLKSDISSFLAGFFSSD